MERIYVTYRARSREEFERWSRERDQPVVRAHPAVLSFDIYMVEEVDSPFEGGPGFDVIEEITVTSWEDFEQMLASEPLKELGDEWREVADAASSSTLRVRKV
jgi:hypothetical protein